MTKEKSALLVATITSFMGPFMISSVNVALPTIQKEFSVDAIQLSWIATSFLLSVAVMLLPIGRFADIHGRKKVFTSGLILYTLVSFFAAFSPSVEALIFFRVIQGFGTAMFVTTGMAIITSIFPPQKRGRAIGIYVAAVYIGLSAGPFLGGILIHELGWRSIFFTVVPIGGVSVYITLKNLEGEWADAQGEKFDVAGSLLYGISVMSLVYGATLLPEFKAIYLVLIGLLFFSFFIILELKIEHPVFQVRLFIENKLFTFSSLAALINYSATFAITFLLSLYLQYIQNIPPHLTGSILIAQPVIMAIFSPLAGRVSDRIEPRLIASTGMAITALGLFLFIFLSSETSKIFIILNLALLGFGFALFSSPNMSAIMGSVEKKFYGIASGTVAFMRLLGQMVSMAAAMVVFAIFIGHQEIEPSNYNLLLKSVRVSFILFTLMCVTGIFFSFFRGHVRDCQKDLSS